MRPRARTRSCARSSRARSGRGACSTKWRSCSAAHELAAPALRGLGAHQADAASLRPDGRQGADGARAAAEPLVARDAVRVGARADDRPDAHRGRDRRDRARLRRPPPARAHQRRARGRLPAGDRRARASTTTCSPRWASWAIEVEILAKPFDLGDSPPFAEDTIHDAYDADAVGRYWHALRLTDAALDTFRSGFNGKQSPVHVFWHSLRPRPRALLGAPGAADARAPTAITAEAYSHEVIAFGWWPGDDRRTPFPAFYSYTAPEPPGLRDHPLEPAAAEWQDTGGGSLAVLPYDAVRGRAGRCSPSSRAPTARAPRPPDGTRQRSCDRCEVRNVG